MGTLFDWLAWLKRLGVDPSGLTHLWSDILAIYSAEDMDARVLACIHFATHLVKLIPGDLDDEIVASLARLTGADAKAIAAYFGPREVGAHVPEVGNDCMTLADSLTECGIHSF